VQQNAKSYLRAARTIACERRRISGSRFQISFIPKGTCGNVLEMSSDAAKKTTESTCTCFIKVIECLQKLAQRQGLAMQGDTDDESNLIQLLKLMYRSN